MLKARLLSQGRWKSKSDYFKGRERESREGQIANGEWRSSKPCVSFCSTAALLPIFLTFPDNFNSLSCFHARLDHMGPLKALWNPWGISWALKTPLGSLKTFVSLLWWKKTLMDRKSCQSCWAIHINGLQNMIKCKLTYFERNNGCLYIIYEVKRWIPFQSKLMAFSFIKGLTCLPTSQFWIEIESINFSIVEFKFRQMFAYINMKKGVENRIH